MKIRHVYSTPNMAVARAVMEAARQSGIAESDLHVVARGDIEEHNIPNRLKEADTDMKPAMLRGALIGIGVGLFAAVLASVTMHTPLSLTWILSGVVGGLLIGTLGSMLVGSSVQEPLRRYFATEIESGKILVIVDADRSVLERADAALRNVGGIALPYDALTAAT